MSTNDKDTNSDVDFVEIDNEQVSLGQLAGIDLTDMDEQRGIAAVPAGVYIMEICLDGEEKGPRWAKIGDKAAAVFPCKVVDVVAIKDKADAPEGDPTKLIGKIHREAMFFTNKDSLKYITAFLVDIGTGKKGSMADLFKASIGKRFQAQITTSKKKDDDSVVYHNINRNQGKIIPAVPKAA